jgi:hypothetical protein
LVGAAKGTRFGALIDDDQTGPAGVFLAQKKGPSFGLPREGKRELISFYHLFIGGKKIKRALFSTAIK